MKTTEELNSQLRTTYSDFVAYRASEQSKCYVAMMDALIEIRQNELMSVSPERLLYVQGQLKQLISLREAIANPLRETIFI